MLMAVMSSMTVLSVMIGEFSDCSEFNDCSKFNDCTECNDW
jgi:hypothetical protein